jgi:hypothetical protein
MMQRAVCIRPCSAGGVGDIERRQGHTLVHVPAQLKRILRDRGARRGCLGGVKEVAGGIKENQRVFRVYFVVETAQVELKSGRV